MNEILKAIKQCETKKKQLLDSLHYHRLDVVDELLFKSNTNLDMDMIDKRLDEINREYCVACDSISQYYAIKISELEQSLD